MADRCPYSGRGLLSCKVSDLCDCFDFPEVDQSAAEITAERNAHSDKWANRELFPLDADVTVYWPDVRPCYEERTDA